MPYDADERYIREKKRQEDEYTAMMSAYNAAKAKQGGVLPLGLPDQNGGSPTPAPTLYSSPGAADPNSSDIMNRAFTRDELEALSQQAVSLRDNPANLGQTGDSLYASVFNNARQQAADRLRVLEQRDTEKKQQDTARTTALDQRNKTLAELKAKVPGLTAQLGENLLNEQQHAYERINPIIEQRLNALGLLQSGALPEAQAKYQGDLESQRQSRLADFSFDAANRFDLGMPYDISEQDIGLQQQALMSDIDLQRAGLQRQFSSQDVANQEYLQRELAAQAAQQADKQRISQMQGGIISSLISGASQMGSAYASGGSSALANARLRRTQPASNAYGNNSYAGYA